MNRIEKKFRELKSQNKKALLAFITAGYPSLSVTLKVARGLSAAGADILELGVPFSDPMADGPVIQEACRCALEKGTHLGGILKTVAALRKDTQIPVCLMTYYNPLLAFGIDKFSRQAASCGVDGLIVPDLPPEEDAACRRTLKSRGLLTIFFLSPTSTPKRIRQVARIARGFIYYVSLTGVTGARKKLAADLAGNLRMIKRYTAKPVCAGFGISTATQVREVWKFCDGAIIGSALVKIIKENQGRRDLVERVAGFTRRLKGE